MNGSFLNLTGFSRGRLGFLIFPVGAVCGDVAQGKPVFIYPTPAAWSAGYEPATPAVAGLRGRSLVDHEPHKLGVAGSIPAPATNFLTLSTGSVTASTALVGTCRGWLARWAAHVFFRHSRRSRRLHKYLAINQSVIQA